MNLRYYVIQDEQLDELAKEYLRAQVNSERSFEELGDGDVFRKYVAQMQMRYTELVEAIGVQPFVVSQENKVGVIVVERMAKQTVLCVPEDLAPVRLPELLAIPEQQYQALRQEALAEMGMNFKKPG